MNQPMIIACDTTTRRITFAVDTSTMKMGVAVCHHVNGETGEIIEEPLNRIGRMIAIHRLHESPLLNLRDALDNVMQDAFKAGHMITLRQIMNKACLLSFNNWTKLGNDLSEAPMPPEATNYFLVLAEEGEQAARMYIEEEMAWSQYKNEKGDTVLIDLPLSPDEDPGMNVEEPVIYDDDYRLINDDDMDFDLF